jgi:hypothetical protein
VRIDRSSRNEAGLPDSLSHSWVSHHSDGGDVLPLGVKPEIMPMHQRINDAHWSLGMALAWITHRSEQPVINIEAAKWAPTKAAIRDLLSALRSGRLIAHGTFVGEGIPRPLETAIWSTFEIIVKRMMFAGHMHVPTSGGSIVVTYRTGFPQARILSATVPAGKANNPQHSWGFEGEPPKAVMKDSGTRDGTL